ncbi:MAG TPA: beta-N-acetylhexosaminidase [Stellaceae bacterium]|nr:beta-N-acetylhexosaminidase [Stellaceae bacterium]
MSNPKAVIFGCAGPRLEAEERDFFRDTDPLGFILFQRNCETPAQLKALVAELRDAVGRDDAPVLIDQEGGRVARLKPPHWPSYPAPARIAALPGEKAKEAALVGARLIADDLARLGITVDCLPVLDLPVAGADAVIGDRALGDDPDRVSVLGRAVCEGLLAGGVLPVVKHIPGHGRATLDSHLALPMVDAPRSLLAKTDFAPFRQLRDMPWAMTAHIVYNAIDASRPATLSPMLIREVIRGEIGFDGVLVSDDLSMQALGGALASRAVAALKAGCDLVLHCNGRLDEMMAIAAAIGGMSREAARRVAAGEKRRQSGLALDRAVLEARFAELLAGGS